MRSSSRQSSFAGGEISPRLHSRSDLDTYGHGLRTCRNFVPTKHGAAQSRDGTRYCGTTGTSGSASRLIPFSFGSTGYVIELYATGIRVWQDGVLLAIDGAATSIGTSWGSADIPNIKVAQIGDVLYLTTPVSSAYTFTRVSANDWDLAALSFAVPVYTTNGRIPLLWGPASANHVIQVAALGGEFPRAWEWKVTLLERWRSGKITESAPYTATDYAVGTEPPTVPETSAGTLVSISFKNEFIVSAQYPALVDFRSAAPPAIGSDPTTIGTRVYRGRNGAFGYVGETATFQAGITGGYFIDSGDEPDYTRPPPQAINPFIIYDSDGTTVLRTERPLTVAFFETRTVFGGTGITTVVHRPGTLFFSRVNDLLNFDPPTSPILATDAGPIEVTLAATKREEIRALLPLDRLLVFTSESVYVVGSAGDSLSPVVPVSARKQDSVGIAAYPDPLVIDGVILYPRASGAAVQRLAYSNDRGAFAGSNVSALADHLLRGDTIRSWDVATDTGVVWIATAGGVLLSVTIDPSLGVTAWAKHTTGASGLVESVAVVREAGVEVVYLAVKRTVNAATVRSVERMVPRDADQADASLATPCCLDFASLFSSPGSATLTGMSHLNTLSVYATGDGVSSGPYTVSGGSVTLTTGIPTTARVGLRYDCDLELLDMAASRDDEKRVTEAVFDVIASEGLYVGESLPAAGLVTDLFEWTHRESGIAITNGTFYSERAPVRIGSGWNTRGRASLRQFRPLPITVTGVVRKVDVGGTR